MATTRKQYRISDLLANSEQPFEDLDNETLDAIEKGIAEGTLLVPIVITSDGVLVDGHQRLQILERNGRVVISGDEVRVIPGATKDDALEWAIRLNVQRRHLTMEQKAAKALELRNTKRWSNNKIAELFGVSGAAVGQWLKGAPKLAEVVGVDGVIQTPSQGRVAAPAVTTPKPWVDPWQGDGPTLRAITRLTAVLEQMVDNAATNTPPSVPREADLGDQQFDFCRMALEELRKAIEAVLAEMATPKVPKPTPTKRPAKQVAARPRTVNGE